MQVYHKNLFYTFLRCCLVNPVINMSLRRLAVKGKENIPKDGAVIIGCNHTCALLDALVILRAMNRATVFMTRADIFRRPLLQKTFTFLKMLPIFRIRDGFASVKQNEEIIRKCVKVLNHHYPLALFPEAKHRPKHSLLPLSKGIFHIAFEANKKFGHKRPVYIVPMGLEYSHYFRYRPTAVATFGRPINVTEFVRQHEGEATPVQIQSMLREELAMRMSELITYVPDTENYEAQWELAKLTAAQSYSLNPAKQLMHNRAAIENVLEMKANTPEEDTATLYANASAFKKKRLKHNIRSSSTKHKRPLAAAVAGSLALLCLLPYYLFCAITTLPSWLLSLLIVSKVKDKAFYNTARFGVNLILWPLLVLMWIIVATNTLPLVAAIMAILLILPGVAFFYDYNTFVLRTWSDWQWALNKPLHSRLKDLLKHIA